MAMMVASRSTDDALTTSVDCLPTEERRSTAGQEMLRMGKIHQPLEPSGLSAPVSAKQAFPSDGDCSCAWQQPPWGTRA